MSVRLGDGEKKLVKLGRMVVDVGWLQRWACGDRLLFLVITILG